MREEFKKAYDRLSIDEKRNQLSNELLIIEQLIKHIESKYEIESILSVKNYDMRKKLSESEMLSFLYEDVYNIEKELITILAAIDIKNNE